MPRNRLTIDDPVDQATLQRLNVLEEEFNNLGRQLLNLESKKLQILVTSRDLNKERVATVERVAMDRGLPPGTPIVIHSETGHVYLRGQEPSDAAPPEGVDEQDGPSRG